MGRRLKATLTVGLIDKASKNAGIIASSLSRLQRVASMPLNKQVVRNARIMKRSAQHLSGASTTIGIAGALLLRNSYVFDKVMAQIAMTSEAPKEKLEELRRKIVEIAEANPKVRKEIAAGALEFITAGNSIDRTISSLKDLTKGAVASMQNVGKTGADVTDIISAMFGNIKDPELYAKKVRDVLNLMSVGASEANHVWGEQTLAMQYSVPVARALGIELDSLTAMIGVLADNGFKGEKGGSALRTILLNLRAPTKAAREAFKELGIEMEKAFSFNDEKAFSPDVLNEKLASRFGTQTAAVQKAVKKTITNKALQGDIGAMRKSLIVSLSEAMNIKPNELERKESLASAIDSHFQAATEKFDMGYLFKKMDKGNVAQVKNITGVKRAPQALAMAKGFDGQYKPKLANIRSKKEGATDRRVARYMDSFAGSVDQLGSKLDGLADTLERLAIVPMFKGISKALSGLVDGLKAADPAWIRFGFYALGALAVMAPLGFALTGIVSAVRLVSAGVGMAGLAIGGLTQMLAAPALLAGMKKFTFMKRGILGIGLALRNLWAPLAILAGVSWPVLLGVAAITLAMNYWSRFAAFFKGFFIGIDDAFQSAGLGRPLESLVNLAKSLIGYLGDAVSYLGNLMGFGAGENATESWLQAGKTAAKALADAISALLSPIKNAYNWMKKLMGFKGVNTGAGSVGIAKIEGRYKGGTVRAGRPYVVGERGPEGLFPSKNAFIASSNQMARMGGGKSSSVGNITVNVNAKGSVNNPSQFGKEVGAAVRKVVLDAHSDGGYG